jgi:hypothetical protein
MKLSPKNKTEKSKYPTIKEYKRKAIITTFTLGMALTPIMATSCMGAQRNPNHIEIKETKIEEPIQKKGDIPNPTLKDNEKTPCNTDDTTKTHGRASQLEDSKDNDNTSSPNKKEEKKDEDKKSDETIKTTPVKHPYKTRGMMVKPKNNIE